MDLTKKRSLNEIEILRENIRKEVKKISTDLDVQKAYHIYNKEVFNNELPTKNVNFHYTDWLTTSAGKIRVSRKNLRTPFETTTYTIKLSKVVLNENTFKKGPKTSNGILCEDEFKAALVTLEHEIIHMVEWMFHKKMGHGNNFMTYVFNCFGHTSYTHDLLQENLNTTAVAANPTITNIHEITNQIIEKNRNTFKKGQKVQFMDRKRKIVLEGIITYIEKNASVTITEGPNAGQKWRVPPSYLTLVE